MADGDDTGDDELAAGPFSDWLTGMQHALSGDGESDVPCGGCTACCRSSQFVHIGPEETGTLARIPAELLFPAPGLPTGNVLLGYDHQGWCPMLVDDRCSIYDERPRSCRTYDCRVFPATGIEPDDKPAIAERARRWRFAYDGELDHVQHDALRAAARLVEAGQGQGSATEHAVLAIRAASTPRSGGGAGRMPG